MIFQTMKQKPGIKSHHLLHRAFIPSQSKTQTSNTTFTGIFISSAPSTEFSKISRHSSLRSGIKTCLLQKEQSASWSWNFFF